MTTSPPILSVIIPLIGRTSADSYPEQLVETSRKMGGFVDVRIASIYLDTSDLAGHPFGMPISITEAWSEGMLVLVRDEPDARRYVGGEAYCYRTPVQAAALIVETSKWGDNRWALEESSSRFRTQPFTTERILPPLLGDWRGLSE